MKRRAAILLVSIFVFLSGCGSSEVKINEDNNGQEVKLSKKQTLVISLKSNPTTGYVWETEDLDENFLKQKGDVKFKPQSNLMGAPGVQIFKFTGVKSGKTELKMVYRRPWEKTTSPAKVFTAHITIR